MPRGARRSYRDDLADLPGACLARRRHPRPGAAVSSLRPCARAYSCQRRRGARRGTPGRARSLQRESSAATRRSRSSASTPPQPTSIRALGALPTRLAGSLRVRAEAKTAEGRRSSPGLHRGIDTQAGTWRRSSRPRTTWAWWWRHRRAIASPCRRHRAAVGDGITALGAAIADASERTEGGSIRFDAPSMREAVLVAVGDSGVLRVTVGPAREPAREAGCGPRGAAGRTGARAQSGVHLVADCVRPVGPRRLGDRATASRDSTAARSSAACARGLPRLPRRPPFLRPARTPGPNTPRRREAHRRRFATARRSRADPASAERLVERGGRPATRIRPRRLLPGQPPRRSEVGSPVSSTGMRLGPAGSRSSTYFTFATWESTCLQTVTGA